MGEKQAFQPLTREDTVTVLLYRAGIALSAGILCGMALYLWMASPAAAPERVSRPVDILLYALYASTGMSVFFIHLYIGKLKTYLKNLYYISLGCLGVLLFIGNSSVSGVLAHEPYGPLLLLPLSGCLGFIAAKEAFCFKLLEGYLLAMLMPVCLLLAAGGILAGKSALSALVLVSVLFVLFTLRKVFMPVAWDIGDKSAYR